MKKLAIILSVLIAIAIKTNAQIQNGGFETWEVYVDNYTHEVYEKPDFWTGSLPRNDAHSFSITKNNESYPAGTGQFSMKIQPDVANGVRGVALSNDNNDPMNNWVPKPSIALDFKPTSLYLYYKCFPSGGDTIVCSIYLYKNGEVISYTPFGTTQTVSSWTPLEIPLIYENSETPDSATVLFAAGAYIQHTASTMYVDNLSFTGFVASVPDLTSEKSFLSSNFNPASDFITLNMGNRNGENLNLSIYNMTGQLVKSEVVKPSQQQVNIKDINNGIYVLVIKSKSRIENKKLIIQR
jgi:hypothetical protein